MNNSIRAMNMPGEVTLDYDRVAQVYEQLSDPLTEDRVFRAVTTLELQIEAITCAFRAGRFADVARVAEGMLPITVELGLLSVEAATRGVLDSASNRNTPAIAATVARLERSSEGSLGALTNPGGQPA